MNIKTTTRMITRTDTGLELSHKPQDDDDVILAEKDGKIMLQYLVGDDGQETHAGNLPRPIRHGSSGEWFVVSGVRV